MFYAGAVLVAIPVTNPATHEPDPTHVALSNLDEDDHNDVTQLAGAYREHVDPVLKNGR